jgi:hypothetical protein
VIHFWKFANDEPDHNFATGISTQRKKTMRGR